MRDVDAIGMTRDHVGASNGGRIRELYEAISSRSTAGAGLKSGQLEGIRRVDLPGRFV